MSGGQCGDLAGGCSPSLAARAPPVAAGGSLVRGPTARPSVVRGGRLLAPAPERGAGDAGDEHEGREGGERSRSGGRGADQVRDENQADLTSVGRTGDHGWLRPGRRGRD
jgi:hypothetical protein